MEGHSSGHNSGKSSVQQETKNPELIAEVGGTPEGSAAQNTSDSKPTSRSPNETESGDSEASDPECLPQLVVSHSGRRCQMSS